MTRRALHCLDCDRPWVISHRCREHHYKLRGWPWPDTRPLKSWAVDWVRRRIERVRTERANMELSSLAKSVATP